MNCLSPCRCSRRDWFVWKNSTGSEGQNICPDRLLCRQYKEYCQTAACFGFFRSRRLFARSIEPCADKTDDSRCECTHNRMPDVLDGYGESRDSERTKIANLSAWLKVEAVGFKVSAPLRSVLTACHWHAAPLQGYSRAHSRVEQAGGSEPPDSRKGRSGFESRWAHREIIYNYRKGVSDHAMH